MPFVVTSNCINCKHTECATVCPAHCFYEGPNFLVINPDECVDCSFCLPACPVGAIVEARDVREDQRAFIRLNAQLATSWPRIRTRRTPPPDHEEWDGVQGKLAMLER
jgi:ferredoxin